MFRYFAFAWNARDVAQSCAAQALTVQLVRQCEWSRAVNLPGLAAFSAGGRPNSSDVVLLYERERNDVDASNPCGAVFGTLFARKRTGGNGRGRLRALRPEDCEDIVNSGGCRLLERWWGRYVAVMRDGDGAVRVIRDPSGTLPCFRMPLRGLQLFFSDVEDCLALEQVPLSVNWRHVAAFVSTRSPTFSAVPRESTTSRESTTALEHVSEVEPGECMTLREGAVRRELLWNPAAIAAGDVMECSDGACEALLQTARECVDAWASCYPGIVHSLSGGLDSSIVLACLTERRAATSISCLHHYGAGADEDERPLARLAAEHFGIALFERPLLPETTDLKAILGIRRSPNLSSYIGSLHRHPHQTRLAHETNAQVIFTGAGGDGLFFQARPDLAVADFLRRRGARPGLLSAAIDAALLSGESAWALLGSALRATNGSDGAHSLWEQCADEALPGKTWQIASLATAPAFQDPLGRADDPERTHPLLSQPLIELCLRIPTYLSIQGGWDRAVARRAFSASLPAAIVLRRAKGSISQFSAALLDANRTFVRELLLEGVLVRERILHRESLERALAGTAVLADRTSSEILHTHVSAEAWARRWCR